MVRSHGPFAVLALAVSAGCASDAGPAAIDAMEPAYAVTYGSAEPDLIHVTAVLPRVPTRLVMSERGAQHLPDGWTTFVANLQLATEAGRAVAVTRDGPRAWRPAPRQRPSGPVRLTYDVHLAHDTIAWSGGIDGAALALPWGAFFSGRAVFVVPEDHDGPVKVRLLPSPGWNVASPWPLAEEGPGAADTTHLFVASGPTALTESYVFIGDFEGFSIARDGFELVFALGGPAVRHRAEEFKATAGSVFDYYIAMMGGTPRPGPDQLSRRILVVINDADVTDGEVVGSDINIMLEPDPAPLARFFSRFGFSHELFHLWNGKSIRRAGPEDWFTEGVTNYYAMKALHEAGRLSEAEFFRFLDEWFYQRYVSDEGFGEISPRAAVSDKHGHWGLVYGGGLFAGICLDAEIRHASSDSASLDDVMRDLFDSLGGSADEFDLAVLMDAVRRRGGYDPAGFVDRYVDGNEPIPIDDCLSRFGLDAGIEAGHLRISRPNDPSDSERERVRGLLGRFGPMGGRGG